MHVFGQNPNFVVECYSQEFEFTFLEHIKRSHGFSRVAATSVYNEYIADRHHLHMNSTQWVTLTGFVKYLGKTGKCKVEETFKGWFIRYVNSDSERLFRDKRKRVRADLVDDEKQDREIMRQIERAQQNMTTTTLTNEAKLFKRCESDGGKIKIKPGAVTKSIGNKEKGERLRLIFCWILIRRRTQQLSRQTLQEDLTVLEEIIAPHLSCDGMQQYRFQDKTETDQSGHRTNNDQQRLAPQFAQKTYATHICLRGETGGSKKKKRKKDATKKTSALDELMREQEMAKEHRNRKDYWLWEGIVVKVMSKTLGYYKQKGVVRKVIHKYVGEIEMIDTKHVLRVDQEELQTVIPQIGGLLKIVNGAYRGSNAKLLAVDTDKFCAKLQIEKGICD
ncbi:hypothetical protein AgCh_018864 [Apium graveolens]